MKNKQLAIHPILGIITFEDVINDLEIMLLDNNLFEDIVYQLLKNKKMPDEDLASLFNYSISDRLKWIIDVLKNSI